MNKKQTISTVWEVWHYDVWGNERDGWEVNDRSCFNRECVIECEVTTHNIGLPNEFTSAYPSDKQIKDALDILPKVKIESDGDDINITVNRATNGYPLGELTCISHASLSPIRELVHA